MSSKAVIANYLYDIRPVGYKLQLNKLLTTDEKSIGIVFKGVTPKYREVVDGKYLQEGVRVNILIQSGSTEADILSGYVVGEELEHKLSGVYNTNITNKYGSVYIQKVNILRGSSFIGFTQNNVALYSLEVEIKYKQ